MNADKKDPEPFVVLVVFLSALIGVYLRPILSWPFRRQPFAML